MPTPDNSTEQLTIRVEYVATSARGGNMAGKTLTKADIVDAIYEVADKNRAEVKGQVESLLLLMKQAI